MFKQSNIVRINTAGEFCYHKYNIPKYPGIFYVKITWLTKYVRRNIIVTPEDNDTIFILTDDI